MLNEKCEYPLLPPPNIPNWAENFVMMFGDPETRITGYCHIGTWSLDTSVWRERLAIVLPDRSIIATIGFGRATKGKSVSASLCKFEATLPGKQARLTYDGPTSIYSFADLLQLGMIGGKTSRLVVDLDFDADVPLWDMHSGDVDPTGMAGGLHLEQIGKVTGRIVVDSREFTIAAAYSCRDHSRGPRDVSRYRNHTWINGHFPSGLAFHCYVFRTLDAPGISMSRAVIFDQGRQYDAKVEQVEFIETVNDHGSPHSLVLNSDRGKTIIKVEQVIATIPISFSAPFDPTFGASRAEKVNRSFDEAVELSCAGERGLGWSERGFSQSGLHSSS